MKSDEKTAEMCAAAYSETKSQHEFVRHVLLQEVWPTALLNERVLRFVWECIDYYEGAKGEREALAKSILEESK